MVVITHSGFLYNFRSFVYPLRKKRGKNMANAEQLKILLSGVEQWNKWRRKNHSVRLDFTGAEQRWSQEFGQ